MKQTHFVALFFCGGIILGSVLSFYFASRDYNAVFSVGYDQSDSSATSRPITEQKDLNDVMREIDRLHRVIALLNSTALNGTKVVYIEKTPTSHRELDLIPGPDRKIQFSDHDLHQDDHSVADDLAKKVRVLCWIMTSDKNLWSRAIHVRESWGRRCNKLLFMSDSDDPTFPAVGMKTEPGRRHLTAKTMRAFDYIYKNHRHDADWFMKADDDTYVIVENLRYMLSAYSPTEPIYFGHHFSVIVKQGYHSGGAGYVISAEALERFGKRNASLCAQDNGAEDVEMGRCLERLHVATGDSRDRLGRSRFHCFNPQTHLHGNYPDWYKKYDKYGARQGVETISDYPVSFHYVSPKEMYDLEYYAYHMAVYGIINGLQDLNGKPEERRTTNTRPRTTTRPRQPSAGS